VLRDLVAEFKSSGPTYQRTVKATLKASYTNHYRVGLIKLLDVLEFRSNNTTHRPVLDALGLITQYASAGNLHYYPAGEHIPVHRGLAGDWDALVYKTDKRRRQRAVPPASARRARGARCVGSAPRPRPGAASASASMRNNRPPREPGNSTRTGSVTTGPPDRRWNARLDI